MTIQVRVDIPPAISVLKDVPQDVIPKAFRFAQNRTITQVRTAIVRKLASDLKVTQKEIRRRTVIRKATRRRPFASMSTGTRAGFWVEFLKPRQDRIGVKYNFLGRQEGIDQGFFGRLNPSKYPKPAKRTGRGGRIQKGQVVYKRRGRARLPIDRQIQSIYDLVTEVTDDQGRRKTAEVFPKNFESNFRYQLEVARRKAQRQSQFS